MEMQVLFLIIIIVTVGFLVFSCDTWCDLEEDRKTNIFVEGWTK